MTNVVVKEKANKDLKHLAPVDRQRIAEALQLLENDPTPEGKKIKKLVPPLSGFRIRIGKYRVLYTLEKDVVYVHRVLLRSDAY